MTVHPPSGSPAPSDVCRVYWGSSGCDLPRGHDEDKDVRVHRQLEPTAQDVSVEDAFLWGEDLTPKERSLIEEVWG